MFSSLMVVVMLHMLLLHTLEAQVDVSVSPTQIDVGLSSSLDVNCTFPMNTSGMAAVFTLTVSRGNNTELASISSFADHKVNVISSEGITADGVINPGGQSYIHLHWDYPTDTQKGTYLCIARGIDVIGHNIETVNTSVVSADQPDFQNVIDELKAVQQMQTSFSQEIQQMQTSYQQMQTSFSQQIQQLQTYITQLKNDVSSLNVQMENKLDRLSTVFHIPPLSYNNKRYYVANGPYQDFHESIIICEAYGGILAEMDDLDEYHAVQNYLGKYYFDFKIICIGGTDEGHNGRWVLPSGEYGNFDTNLPVTDWLDSPLFLDEANNCLCLFNADSETKMIPWYCHGYSEHFPATYMCEI